MNHEDLRFASWVARQGGLDIFNVASLDELRENKDYVHEEVVENEEDYAWHTIKHGLANMHSDQWAVKMGAPSAGQLALLVELLEDYEEDAVKNVGKDRFYSVRTYTRVMGRLTIAVEQGKKFVRVSDYLHVMWLRELARIGEISHSAVSDRALGKRFGVDGKTIAAWDKRAKELHVTPSVLDSERLRQIMKPSRRAPP